MGTLIATLMQVLTAGHSAFAQPNPAQILPRFCRDVGIACDVTGNEPAEILEVLRILGQTAPVELAPSQPDARSRLQRNLSAIHFIPRPRLREARLSQGARLVLDCQNRIHLYLDATVPHTQGGVMRAVRSLTRLLERMSSLEWSQALERVRMRGPRGIHSMSTSISMDFSPNRPPRIPNRWVPSGTGSMLGGDAVMASLGGPLEQLSSDYLTPACWVHRFGPGGLQTGRPIPRAPTPLESFNAQRDYTFRLIHYLSAACVGTIEVENHPNGFPSFRYPNGTAIQPGRCLDIGREIETEGRRMGEVFSTLSAEARGQFIRANAATIRQTGPRNNEILSAILQENKGTEAGITQDNITLSHEDLEVLVERTRAYKNTHDETIMDALRPVLESSSIRRQLAETEEWTEAELLELIHPAEAAVPTDAARAH